MLAALAVPGAASAATTHTDYAPDAAGHGPESKDVRHERRWLERGATQAGPLCALVITCPGVANTLSGPGGADQGAPGNDGFIRTAFTTPGLVGLATDLTVVRGIWTSPPFTYNGDNARANDPDHVRFLITRRSNASTLVNIPVDNEISYSVDIVPAGSGDEAVSVISEETVDLPTSFAPRGAVEIDPDDLDDGCRLPDSDHRPLFGGSRCAPERERSITTT